MGYVEDVEIILDKPRPFRVALGTVKRFQAVSGMRFTEFTQQLEDTEDIEAVIDIISQLIWAGCVGSDPSLTLDTVLDNLGINPTIQIAPVFEAIRRHTVIEGGQINGNNPLDVDTSQMNPSGAPGGQSGPLVDTN